MSTTAPERVDRSTVRLRGDALPWANLFVASKATGLTHSSLWRAARGEHAPSAGMIATLLAVTGKRFEDLFEVVPDKGRAA